MLHTSKIAQMRQSRNVNESGPKKRRQLPAILNRITQSDTSLLVRDFLEAVGSARALTAWLLFSSHEHKQLVELSIDSRNYTDHALNRAQCGLGAGALIGRTGAWRGPDAFRDDYAATKFLSKCAGLETGINLEAVAIASAIRAEDMCHKTNARLIQEAAGRVVIPDVVSRSFLSVTAKIASILGNVPTSFQDVGWSRGRTSSAHGDACAGLFKYSSRLDVTLSARSRGLDLVQQCPNWGAAVLDSDGPCTVLSQSMTVVRGNTMITVPKNAKTDRVICYEPHVNIRLQRQVGEYMSSRLRKHGVVLNDQTINQRRARLASKTGHLATLDLSMASDTLATELVFQLLPIDWAILLDDLRSKQTHWPDGSWRRNAKFSSMGNGFTFELESLIFYALASAVSANVSVYGDDIICPVESYTDVKSMLNWAGFTLNESKSFHNGCFRESCGDDSFDGLSVTPPYLRRLPKTTEDVIHLHNSVRAWCSKGANPDTRFKNLLKKWRDVHTCHCGPSGYGDGHYHVDLNECVVKHDSETTSPRGLDGWWFTTYTRVTRVNSTYGDKVHGFFDGADAFAALCVSTGPKASQDVFTHSANRRESFWKKTRVLANFVWPTVAWAS